MVRIKMKNFLQKISPKSLRRKKDRVIWGQSFQSSKGEKQISLEEFKELFKRLYPAGENFLSCIMEYKSGGRLNTFVLDAHLAGLGFISAKTSVDFIVRETIMHELDRTLKERAHRIDVTSVRIDGRHEGDDFVIQLSFRNLSTANEQGGQLSEIE
ncbi:MAG: hypothetical protein HDS35_00200 [Bacteroides sp.]|nr:hypothetical protein [Bacteroides sp.]